MKILLKLNNMTKKQRIFAIICCTFVFFVTLSLLILRFLPFPELKDFLENRKYSTQVFDCNDEIIQILPLENGLRREFTKLEDIPEQLKKAFIKAEDRRFYVHPGFSVASLSRAALQNIFSRKTISGASTITMQLARIICPQSARNVFTKGLEIINAIRLELRLSKKQILELYLNNVPFGFNTEGVGSAARTFFGKELSLLSSEELYCLAIIPRRPSLYNPLENPKETALQASKVLKKDFEPIYKAAKKSHSYKYEQKMPHYIEYLKKIGYLHYQKEKVKLSASLILQEYASDLLSKSILQYQQNRITNGAILVINTQTGEILSWVGSGDFYNQQNQGQNDGVLALNQPGSSMKPFLYALALDNGFSTNTILPDIQTDFGSSELYIPQNFNNRFNGPVRFRVALASSLNVPAVYMLDKLGIENYLDKLNELKFNSLKNIDYGLGLALGNAEVSLFELVQGFSVFPRDGYFLPLVPSKSASAQIALPQTSPQSSTTQASTTSITSAQIALPQTSSQSSSTQASTTSITPSQITPTSPLQVYSTKTSRLICDILSDKQSRALGFGYSQTYETTFPSMFKTGTANQYQNITALGATPLYTIGVWMGNFDGSTVIGRTGSSIPAYIAKTILEGLQTEKIPFNKVIGIEKKEICSLSGMLASSECKNTIYEYTDETNYCDWHIGGTVHYPQIYEQFLLTHNQGALISQNNLPLTITRPNDGSIFYYDNNLGERQKITFELNGINNKKFSVTVIEKDTNNIVDYFELENTNKFTIVPTKGTFQLIVECNDESAEINYTVF